MAKATFVKTAKTNIYKGGAVINSVAEKGPQKGETITTLDKTKPAHAHDKVLIAKGEPYWWWMNDKKEKQFSKTEPKSL